MSRVHDRPSTGKTSDHERILREALADDPNPRTRDGLLAELAHFAKADARVLADALRSTDPDLDSAAHLADRNARILAAILDLVAPKPPAVASAIAA